MLSDLNPRPGVGKTILAAAIGGCVHVAGVYNFLRLARAHGYDTCFLGPAVPVARLIGEIERQRPDIVAISYRLTPEAADNLLGELERQVSERGLTGPEYVFGGTPPVVAVARRHRLFQRFFAGEGDAEATAYLRRVPADAEAALYPDGLIERLAATSPRPLLRHHFGRPSLAETTAGVRAIAESGAIDIISIGPDQNAQESFFRPSEQRPEEDGAGGVPLRTPADLRGLKQAAAHGNHPLLRCYSGTRDLLQWAPLLVETINNAWAAIPLCWYNQLDGRSDRPVAEAVRENQLAMRWHAERGIPVEVNEPHHWGLRGAHDAVTVAAHYLAAYNARHAGVRTYIAQFMLNTPVGTSYPMDLAKMLAATDLLRELESDDFRIIRQIRTGLTSLATDPAVAKGQVISSLQLGLQLKPDIIHIVGFSEADHAATAAEVIEAGRMAHGMLRNTGGGLPWAEGDFVVAKRRAELLTEARILLWAIGSLSPRTRRAAGDTLGLADPDAIAAAISLGLLDAPQLLGRPGACGEVRTELIDGGWYAVDPETGRPLRESERVGRLLDAYNAGVRA
ncbi:MAG: cobalamin-dependent protein [Chloroflexota bacterium]